MAQGDKILFAVFYNFAKTLKLSPRVRLGKYTLLFPSLKKIGGRRKKRKESSVANCDRLVAAEPAMTPCSGHATPIEL